MRSRYQILAIELCRGQKGRRALDTKLELGDRASFEFSCPVIIHAGMLRSERILGDAGIQLTVSDVPCVGPTRGIWTLTPKNVDEKCSGLIRENQGEETPR